MTLERDVQTLAPGVLVELFVLDASVIDGSTVYRFFPGGVYTSSVSQFTNIVWQGNTYTAMPIQVSGFDASAQGPMPRPRMTLANVGNIIGSLCSQFDDFVGATVTRKRTLMKYLDAVNFANGNASADPNAHWPDESFLVERKVEENSVFIEFELSSPLDMEGAMLPARQVIQNLCPFVYRGPDCGYSGGAVAKIDDTPTTDINEDRCGKHLSSCQLRNWPNNELPFGGFPGAGLVR